MQRAKTTAGNTQNYDAHRVLKVSNRVRSMLPLARIDNRSSLQHCVVLRAVMRNLRTAYPQEEKNLI